MERSSMVVLETNIDDMNPQLIEHVAKRLFAAGAKDVWSQPIYMKKGRPAVTFSVLGTAGSQDALVKILVSETTTLGVRVFACDRLSLQREMKVVSTQFGDVHVKYGLLDGQVLNSHPEYEDCCRVAEQSGLPLKAVFSAVEAAVERASGRGTAVLAGGEGEDKNL